MNLICKIKGHDRILRDFYPSDPISSVACLRCKEILDVRQNPAFNGKIQKIKELTYVGNIKEHFLTYGKNYDIINIRNGYYAIKNDKGIWSYYHYKYFKERKELRKIKLNKLNEKI